MLQYMALEELQFELVNSAASSSSGYRSCHACARVKGRSLYSRHVARHIYCAISFAFYLLVHLCAIAEQDECSHRKGTRQ